VQVKDVKSKIEEMEGSEKFPANGTKLLWKGKVEALLVS
jgi:hypothetical protein